MSDRRMPFRFYPALMSLVLLAALPVVRAEADGSPAYRLGRGYPVGRTGIRLGGYASTKVEVPREGPWKWELSDISLFINWEDGQRWRFFSETEVGEALSGGEDQDFGAHEAHFELERLYLDHIFSDALALRFGKFLTPVGRWNLLHANPLVWTTTRPVATEQLFSKHGTGLMLHGGLPLADKRLDYSFYADVSDSLDPAKSENPFENALGGHLLYSLSDSFEVGLSYANYRLHDSPDARYNLVGAEGYWSYRKYEINSEWVLRSGGKRKLWQGYIQGIVPLYSRWYAVGRYEYFQQEQGSAGQLGVFGVAYRPLPPLVWKLEYRLGTQNEAAAPDGLYGSFAVLF